jgi:hypothetical protein
MNTPDYLNEAPMKELYEHYCEYVPEVTQESVFSEGVERFEEGQKLGLCPDEALKTPPLAIIEMLTDVEEEPERVIHSLRAAERAARATDAPIDLALWCNFELPDYADVYWDYLPPLSVTRFLAPRADKNISEAAALAWASAVNKAHDANYSLYERLIDRILAARIDSTFLRIRPVFKDEAADAPLTTKRRHNREGTLADAEARDLSPDTPLIILDSDTTFVGKRALSDIIRHVQKHDKPLVKARTVFTSEPNSTPIAKRRQSERLAAMYAVAQYIAEANTFQNSGTLPYTDEVASAASLRVVCSSLGFATPQPRVIGESRAFLHNIQDNLGIMPKDAVHYLPNSRVGTSNRRIIQEMGQWLARPNRLSMPAVATPDTDVYSNYRSATEQSKNSRVLAVNLGANSDILGRIQTSEAPEPLAPEDVLAVCHDAIAGYQKEFTGEQKNRLLRLAGRLGLIEGPGPQAA